MSWLKIIFDFFTISKFKMSNYERLIVISGSLWCAGASNGSGRCGSSRDDFVSWRPDENGRNLLRANVIFIRRRKKRADYLWIVFLFFIFLYTTCFTKMARFDACRVHAVDTMKRCYTCVSIIYYVWLNRWPRNVPARPEAETKWNLFRIIWKLVSCAARRPATVKRYGRAETDWIERQNKKGKKKLQCGVVFMIAMAMWIPSRLMDPSGREASAWKRHNIKYIILSWRNKDKINPGLNA